MNIAEMIIDTEITLITKKTRKETKVYVSAVEDNGKTFLCLYTNKFKELSIKRFDMTKYDFCL